MVGLFDLDGTIFGTYRRKNEIRNEIAEDLGLPRIDNSEYYEAFREVIGGGKVDTRLEVFERLLDNPGLADEFDREYRKRSLENTYVYPDAEEVLQNMSIRKGLVTNGPRLIQRDKIEKFDLEKYFDAIVISGELGEAKPEPEIFYHALEALNSPKDGSFYVGDTPKLDVAGAKNAGIISILINRTGDPSGPKPDYEIKDLRELSDIFEV